jgi:para-nitrobenzyl esterase
MKIPTTPIDAPNPPVADGKYIPGEPFDAAALALSATVPLMIGWTRTEASDTEIPTPENMALDEAGLRERTAKRLQITDTAPVIAAFRETFPDATPWDLWVLIATAYVRSTYTQEMARRKAQQGGAPAYLYRFDFETPEHGGHLRSPHGIEVAFAWQHIDRTGPLMSKMPEAHALSDKVSAAWAAFAHTGNPNAPGLPNWPAYSVPARETMLFNVMSQAKSDPQHAARIAMEKVLKIGSGS